MPQYIIHFATENAFLKKTEPTLQVWDEPPVPMTAELFVSIIDAHHRVDDDLRVDPAAVKLYNKTVSLLTL